MSLFSCSCHTHRLDPPLSLGQAATETRGLSGNALTSPKGFKVANIGRIRLLVAFTLVWLFFFVLVFYLNVWNFSFKFQPLTTRGKSQTEDRTRLNNTRTTPPALVTEETGQRKVSSIHPVPEGGDNTDTSTKITEEKGTATQNVSCHFPNLDPFDPKIAPFIETHPTVDCTGNIPAVVYVTENFDLRVDPEKVKSKLKSKAIDWCKYRNIEMKGGSDYKIRYGPWSASFQTSIHLKDSDDILQVDCVWNSSTLVSRSYHALIRRKTEMEERRKADYLQFVKKEAPKETLSLLFVGMDGMSKENVIRTMPKTREYLLTQYKAIEYKQFNKVGLNTFPNVFPLLTGKTPEEVEGWNFGVPFDTIDHLFSWNRYQKAGYRTAIMFDTDWMTAFHYEKLGWNNAPFDYYHRPITVASINDETYRNTSRHCMGDMPEVTHLLDYWLQLTTAYNSTPSTPYFAYSFLSKLSHDYQGLASAGDELYLQFFKELYARNVLGNTLLIFFSDHGARFGDFRHTYNGVYEARSPMLFFVFPPWFESKYPEVMANFRKNVHRLTTFFDFHETLEELLTFTGKPRKPPPSMAARGISLFSEIPANRTCETAGIPIKFCGCAAISRDNVESSEVTKVVVDTLVKAIVKKSKDQRDSCVELRLNATVNVMPMMPEVPFKDENQFLYHVTVRTSPGGALYESSVLHSTGSEAGEVIGEIARLNMYRGQAECVKGALLRPFCYCKNTKG